jgi:hypothetical protein
VIVKLNLINIHMGVIASVAVGALISTASSGVGLYFALMVRRDSPPLPKFTQNISILHVGRVPQWIKQVELNIFNNKYKNGMDVPKLEISEDTTREVIIQYYIDLEFGLLDQIMAIPHGMSSVQGLIQLLFFRLPVGMAPRHLNLGYYSWLLDDFHIFNQILETTEEIPIPNTIISDRIGFDSTKLMIPHYGALNDILTYLIYIFGYSQNKAVFGSFGRINAANTPIIKDFKCCAGSYADKFLGEMSREELLDICASFPIFDGKLRSPRYYTSASRCIVVESRDGWSIGWAPNIWSPLAPFCAWAKHGESPKTDIPFNLTVPIINTKRWPNHFTSWIGCRDHKLNGRISSRAGASVNVEFYPRGVDLSSYPIRQSPVSSLGLQPTTWADRCNSHHANGFPSCEQCEFISDYDLDTEILRLDQEVWVPYSMTRVLVELFTPFKEWSPESREAYQWAAIQLQQQPMPLSREDEAKTSLNFYDVWVGIKCFLRWTGEVWAHVDYQNLFQFSPTYI